jgi:hypothetical protein
MAHKEKFPYLVRQLTESDKYLPHSGVPTRGPNLVGEVKENYRNT